MGTEVRIYLDLSNITCGARRAATASGSDPWTVRLHAGALFELLAAGRPVASATLVMNSSVPEPIRRRFGQYFRLIEVERGVLSGLDQAADERLQNRMYIEMHEPQEPGVVVLGTGDGAGWAERSGFTRPLIVARQLGHGVEVASFLASLHFQLRRLARMPGNALVQLDQHFGSITFESGGDRFPEPLQLGNRAVASPHPWRGAELDWLDPRLSHFPIGPSGTGADLAGDAA